MRINGFEAITMINNDFQTITTIPTRTFNDTISGALYWCSYITTEIQPFMKRAIFSDWMGTPTKTIRNHFVTGWHTTGNFVHH
jgi:hypothetical protein